MRRRKVFLLLILLLIAVVLFTYKYINRKDGIRILETSRVERGDITGILVETGIIKPQVGAIVKIGTRATGRVTRMNVRVGDRVRNGQLIALIDDREILQAIEETEANLRAHEERMRQVELVYPERIKEAEANYEYARLTYERELELLKKEYTTRDSLDRAKAQLDIAEASLKRLKEEYRTERNIINAEIESLKAQLNQHRTRLSYTRIYSPIDGVVSEVTAQEGETIVAGLQVANLVTVIDPLKLEMWIYVDETDIGKIRIGQKVEYYVDTFPERIFHGKIEKIYPQPVVKDNIVYYLATVTVSKEDAILLRPEMTTHVRIMFNEKKNVLTIPNGAIKYREGRQIVYLVHKNNTVEEKEIKTGLRGEEKTEVLEGLKEGDTVATKIILPVTKR